MAFFVLLFVINTLITHIDSTIYYVNPSASSYGNGLSWNTAFNTLENALLAASKSIDKLYLVGNHVYIPSHSTDRTKCFYAANGIEIYGGFDGTESNENERSIDAEPSILSGDIGIMNDNGDNCYHVLIFSDFLILDNVIIENGNANYQNSADYLFQTNILHRYGAGIIHSNLTKSFSLSLNNVIFRNNRAINGGALFLRGSFDNTKDVNVLIMDSKFEYNTAIKGEYEGGYGGAIYAMLGMNMTVLNTEFNSNSADLRGGAIYQAHDTLLSIDDCVFNNNAVNGWGGAIFGEDSPNTKIISSTFSSNSAGVDGGAIAFIDVISTISGTDFTGNSPNNEYDDALTEYTAIDDSLSIDLDAELTELFDSFNTLQIDIFPFDDSDFLCFVDPTANGLDGESWNSAYRTLEGCLEKLKDFGGEIWVKSAWYVPSNIPLWKQRLNKVTALHRSYSLYPNIRIYGGFDGTETNRNQRNIKDNPTYFSCQQTKTKQCYQLFQAADDCLLDGFIFINSGQGIMGRRRLMTPNNVDTNCWDCGGGIFSNNSNIHIANSIFLKLFSGENGGAIYCIGPDKFASFSNVHFLGNRATKNGGAIHATFECNFVCTHCKFLSNSALNGGAISVDSSSFAQFKFSSLFISNVALNEGASLFGGYFGQKSGFLFEQRSIFSNNVVQNHQKNIFGFPFTKFALNGTILPTTHIPTLSPTPSPISNVRHNGKPNIILFVVDDTLPNLAWSQYSAPSFYSDEYGDYSTPNIDSFVQESVIFPRSYCGGPKCSPSRFSLLTGRYATRSEWAIFKTLKTCSGEAGTNVTIQTSKMYANDGINNLPHILQSQGGYYTGQVGKWHLLSLDDNGKNYGCWQLSNIANEELYTKCKNILFDQGFSFVDAWYNGNIDENPSVYSHNPEWMLSQSQKFINYAVNVEKKPFFLYFAMTLMHDPDIYNALFDFDMTDSPKGILTNEDVPNDTQMMSRSKIWSKASDDASTFRVNKLRAAYFWADDAFGALCDFLKINGLYDSTMIVFMNDHGMGAKTTLYEQGSRILNFVRYPPLFGDNGPMIMPQSLIVSNVDLAMTIFDICDIVPPTTYKSDGVSWLNAVQNQLSNVNAQNNDDRCCQYRHVDMFNGHSIVSEQYEYIYRANVNNIAVDDEVTSLYPHFYANEQLYDLIADPNQQINLISDESLSIIIATFQTLMREYLSDVCPISQCLMPDFLYTLSPTSPTSAPTTAAPTAPTLSPTEPTTTMSVSANETMSFDESENGSEKEENESGNAMILIIIICVVVLICCCLIVGVLLFVLKKRRADDEAFENGFAPKTKPKHLMAVPSASTMSMFDYDNGSIQMSMNKKTKNKNKHKHMEAVPSSSAFSMTLENTFRSSVKTNHLALPSTFSINNLTNKCAQCGNVAKGKCDEQDAEFYCFECWQSWPQQ